MTTARRITAPSLTVAELKEAVADGILKQLHTDSWLGYVPDEPVAKSYKGWYGEGYALISPNWRNAWLGFITYYVFTTPEDAQ